MRTFTAALVVLIVPTFLFGCASIVAPGQTRAEMDASGATRWAVTEYDFAGSRFVWIPHWTEGALNVSTPRARNVKSLDVLEYRDGALVGVERLGEDRERWAAKLTGHGRIKPAPADAVEADPIRLAVTERIIHDGAPRECVFFAAGFPSFGPNANPRVKRSPSEINPDDVLYYLVTQGGKAMEIVLKGGKVSEKREAEPLTKDWMPFYHPVRR